MTKIKQTTPTHDFVVPQGGRILFFSSNYILAITQINDYVFRYKTNGEYIESTMPKEAFESIYTLKGE